MAKLPYYTAREYDGSTLSTDSSGQILLTWHLRKTTTGSDVFQVSLVRLRPAAQALSLMKLQFIGLILDFASLYVYWYRRATNGTKPR